MDSRSCVGRKGFEHNGYRNAYQHVVMHPHPKVVHIHFREQDEAVDVLARIDALDCGSPSVSPNIGEIILYQQAKGSSLYHEGLQGICWHGDEIVRDCLPRMAPLLSFEEVILHRELADRDGEFSLITTWAHYGCPASLLRHEMAHAIWRHHPAYRKAATAVVSALPAWVAKELLGRLMDCGYVNEEKPYGDQAEYFVNEMQARVYDGCRGLRALHGWRVVKPFTRAIRRIVADFCPMLNDTDIMRVCRWRTLHDSRQVAGYTVWRDSSVTETRQCLL